MLCWQNWCYEWFSLLLWMSGHTWRWLTKVCFWCWPSFYIISQRTDAFWETFPEDEARWFCIRSFPVLQSFVCMISIGSSPAWSFPLVCVSQALVHRRTPSISLSSPRFGAEEPGALLHFCIENLSGAVFLSSRAKGLHAAHLSSSGWLHHYNDA